MSKDKYQGQDKGQDKDQDEDEDPTHCQSEDTYPSEFAGRPDHKDRTHTDDKWKPHLEPVVVDLNSLQEFADHLQQERDKNILPNVRRLDELRKALGRADPFGQKSKGFIFQEVNYFEQRHNVAYETVWKFMAEMSAGVGALGLAAQSLAFEYWRADAFGKCTLDSVNKTFTPPKSQPQPEAAAGMGPSGAVQAKIDESLYTDPDKLPEAPKSDGKGYWVNGKEGDPDAYYVQEDNEDTRSVPKTEKDPPKNPV